MIRAGRDHLTGWVEVDETYVGGWEEGMKGRRRGEKSLIVIAAQVVGNGTGRIRMRVIPDASADSLLPFIESSVEPGNTVHTDGWLGYAGVAKKVYGHEVSLLRGRPRQASKLLPRVHCVASLLKRWLLGTHQGAVEPQHLAYYLDEFTFRFNRRTSKSRGKLFYRLMQQAVATEPTTFPLSSSDSLPRRHPTNWGYLSQVDSQFAIFECAGYSRAHYNARTRCPFAATPNSALPDGCPLDPARSVGCCSP